jgi:hypothetical protein
MATTEIINKPLNHNFRGFYISTRITPGLVCTSLKIGLAKDRAKVLEFLTLAQEINRVSLCGELHPTVLAMLALRIYCSIYSDETLCFLKDKTIF